MTTKRRLELAAVGDDALLPGGVIIVNGRRLDLPDCIEEGQAERRYGVR
jgi:hypothetical protein